LLAQPTNWITEYKDTKSSQYVGTVMENNDPLKLSRVKVRVTELHGTPSEIPDSCLPWINQQPSISGGGNSNFSIPEVGSTVKVEYPNSNVNFGYYSAGAITPSNRNTNFDTNYPNAYGFSDSTGNVFKIDKVSKTMTITHSSGVTININSAGNISVDGEDLSINTNSITANVNDFTVNGNFGCSTGKTLVMTGSDGKLYEFTNGILTNVN